MSTGAEYLNATRKRLLGREDLDDRFLSHLRTLVQESFEKSYRTGIVFDTALGLAADGNDKFQITGTSPSTDGLGHQLDHRDRAEYYDDLQFENAAAIDYDVALHYTTLPNGVQINPRSGLPEYISWEEGIGESADPDSVTDNGNGTITFRVDSVAEPGVSHAGRKCLVFKKTVAAGATTEAVAVEILTVTWSGGQNLITTVAALGQTTISTTASDYTVVMLGPTVRRNTSLLGIDGYVFIGQVTGVGAGSPPSSFDTSGQDVVTGSLADLQDITSRNATTDRLKVDVKSYTGDVSDPQIAVRNPAGSIVFKVDGNGNVTVEGTTTQQDVVTVYSSETITDNLTAGDATGDSHKIKGTWWHTNPAESANYFKVDGASGRIGFNTAPDGAMQFKSDGDWWLYNSRLYIQGDGGSRPACEWRDTGEALNDGGLWRVRAEGGFWRLEENTAVAGDYSTLNEWIIANIDDPALRIGRDLWPHIDGSYDLGASDHEWQDLWIDGTANIDLLNLSVAASEGFGSHLYPSADDTHDLGASTSRALKSVYTHDLYVDATQDRGVGSDLNPQAHNTYNLGSAARSWANMYVINLNVGADILPSGDNLYDLGSPSFRWAEGHFGGGSVAGAAGVTASGGPTSGPGFKGTGGTPNGVGLEGTGTGTGAGLKGTGSTAGSAGVEGTGTNNNSGLKGTGHGTGGGIEGTGGATGNGVHGIGGSTSGYGVIAEADVTSPQKAALRIVPQDTHPSVSPATGDTDVLDGKLYTYNGSMWIPQAYSVDRIIADSAEITNTTTETVFSNGTHTIEGGTMRAGSMIRFYINTKILQIVATPTLAGYVRVGGLSGQIIIQRFASPAGVNDQFTALLIFVVRSVGPTGSYTFWATSAHDDISTGPMLVAGAYGPGPYTADFDNDLDIVVTAQWTVASTQNRVVLKNFISETVEDKTS